MVHQGEDPRRAARARTEPFGIAVRSERESRDPPLTYRDQGATTSVPTHLIPQTAVVVTRCEQPADRVFDQIGPS